MRWLAQPKPVLTRGDSAMFGIGIAPGGGGAAAPLRTASAVQANTVHSGHSLTDTFFQGGYPGVLHSFRQAASGVSIPAAKTAKSTIPGSSTKTRWDGGGTMEVNARTQISGYDLLTITERGLDVTGLAFPYSIDNPVMAAQMAEDMDYLWRFVDNARRNGNGGAGAETLLWAIWPAIDGSMGDFRLMLDAYEHRWHYRQEIINRWLVEAGATARRHMHVIPGHRLMARIYDDIQAGVVPGVTAMQDLFADNIHPNHLGVYAVGCLVHAVIWQQNPAGLSYDTTPSTPAALRTYFQTIAWQIATSYARAGMGGQDMGAPGILPAPTDVNPSTIPGFAWQTTGAIVSDGTATALDVTIPATGPTIYGVIAFTPGTQPADEAILMHLATAGGQLAGKLNYRASLSNVLLEAGGSGHAAHGPVAPGAANIMEFWITPQGATMRGIGPAPSSAPSVQPAAAAAVRLRVGWHEWGAARFNGTIHGLALFTGVPSAEDRVRMRAWAHDRAGRPFAERAVPALPATYLGDLYGIGPGKIPMHLRVRDAVMSGQNVVSVPNIGGAGAYFDATAGGVPVTRTGGLIQFTNAFSWLQLANAADMDGVRLFVVAKRGDTGNRRLASMEGAGTDDGVVTNDRMVVIYPSPTPMADGGAGSVIRLATGFGSPANNAGPFRQLTDLALYEIEKRGSTVRVTVNCEPDAVSTDVTTAGAFLIRRLFSSQINNPTNWNDQAGDVVSLVDALNHPAEVSRIRRAFGEEYGKPWA